MAQEAPRLAQRWGTGREAVDCWLCPWPFTRVRLSPCVPRTRRRLSHQTNAARGVKRAVFCQTSAARPRKVTPDCRCPASRASCHFPLRPGPGQGRSVLSPSPSRAGLQGFRNSLCVSSTKCIWASVCPFLKWVPQFSRFLGISLACFGVKVSEQPGPD